MKNTQSNLTASFSFKTPELFVVLVCYGIKQIIMDVEIKCIKKKKKKNLLAIDNVLRLKIKISPKIILNSHLYHFYVHAFLKYRRLLVALHHGRSFDLNAPHEEGPKLSKGFRR